MRIRDLYIGVSLRQIIKEITTAIIVIVAIHQYLWLLDAVGLFSN